MISSYNLIRAIRFSQANPKAVEDLRVQKMMQTIIVLATIATISFLTSLWGIFHE